MKLESGNQKIQYGRQAAILKVTSLKIKRLLPMTTINMPMKFEIEIPKQTWLMLRKPCRLQTDGRTDGRTRWIQYTPPPTSLGRGIITMMSHGRHVVSSHQSFDCLFNSLIGPTSKKHQSPHYWPFLSVIHRWLVNSPHKGPVTLKKLPFNDVIMGFMEYTSGWLFTVCCKRTLLISHEY